MIVTEIQNCSSILWRN